MNTEHTPGPWTKSETMQAGGWDIYGDNIWIGSIHNDHFDKGKRPRDGFPGNIEGEANARLVAVAPELIDALQALLNQFEKWEGYHQWDEEDEKALEEARTTLAKLK